MLLCPSAVRRPPSAFKRFELLDAERVIYRLSNPQRDSTTVLTLTPLELVDYLGSLIPPPSRHRYHCVLAPNSRVRAPATAYGRVVA